MAIVGDSEFLVKCCLGEAHTERRNLKKLLSIAQEALKQITEGFSAKPLLNRFLSSSWWCTHFVEITLPPMAQPTRYSTKVTSGMSILRKVRSFACTCTSVQMIKTLVCCSRSTVLVGAILELHPVVG